jgi:methyl-accepting chemotaxis protein/cell division protein FtsL
MKFRFSLRFKILGLVFTTCLVLCALTVINSIQQNSIAETERNKAVRKANIIALDGSLERHQSTLEKISVNLLNTDELISFMTAPDGDSSKMVLEGMFLSFQEEGIVRLTLYSADGKTLLEQAVTSPLRQNNTPPNLKSIYEKAEKDFNFHFYFRGKEETKVSFPVEYCLVTVVTDDDDKVLGFAELALSAEKWLTGIAELTGNIASLQDPDSGLFTLSTNENPGDFFKNSQFDSNSDNSFLLEKVSDNWWLTDRILITGPGNDVVSLLLITQDSTESVTKAKNNRMVTLFISASIVISALAGTYLIVRRGVLYPIEQVVNFSRNLAEGHFVDSLNITTKDEVADMGNALNDMAAKIRQRAREAEAISTGDLTVQISIESPNDVLGNSLKKIVDNLGETIKLVHEDAERLQESSEKIINFSINIQNSSATINDRTTSISGVSQGISEDIEKLAAATEEMSASVHEISENTSRSKVVSSRAKELSQRAGETISNLDDSTKKIEAASVAISEFADQTNLLSLNATIEAARAGDAGKGFAVVASEVKELANQSITTTKSITHDVDEIQKHTALVVQHTEDVSKSVTELDESSIVVSAALTEQSVVAGELASTISGTYEKVKTFTENIADISESINSNNEVIGSLTSSSHEMSELASRLKTLMNRFSLP